MGIVNGPAPESGAIDWMTTLTMERDSLQVQLQESERLRTEAFHACEAMRLDCNDWKRKADYQQEQATQLRLQVEASLEQEQGVSKKLIEELAVAKNQASKTGWVLVGSHLPNREQLNAEIVRLTNNWGREIDERKALQQQVAALKASVEHEQSANRVLAGKVVKLQTQLDAAAVTPAQQPDGNAALRLEAVRRLIGEIRGWYACVEYFDEIKWAEAWEQVGALLGRLQREAD